MAHNIDDVLQYISERLREEVRLIIEDSSVSIAEKKKYLGDILKTSPTLLKYCEEFLDKIPDYSNPDLSIQLIESNIQRKMARERVKRDDIPALEAIIATQGQTVQDAYRKSRACYRARKRIEVPQMAIDSTKIDIVPPAEVFEKRVLYFKYLFMRLLDETNILMMGATGAGKSTFINAFVNYMKFPTLEAAEDGQLEILIKAHFLETSSKLHQAHVNLEPTISPENGADSTNESDGVGEAATQFPKSYIFKWGTTGQEKLIRIIDTPGVGDCRGIDQEKINMDRTLRFLSNFKQLHAICIVVKANEARKTASFRYCLNQLPTHLHISAYKNIMFVFTNCGASGFGPGNSYVTLKDMIQDIKKEKKDVELSLDGNTIFCFENDSFRYLCVKKVGNMFFTSAERNRFVASWQKSAEATSKLLGRIASKDIPPHLLSDTLSVNNTRAMIPAIGQPLAEISRVQLMNIEMLKEKQAEMTPNSSDSALTTNKHRMTPFGFVPPNRIELAHAIINSDLTSVTCFTILKMLCSPTEDIHDGKNRIDQWWKKELRKDDDLYSEIPIPILKKMLQDYEKNRSKEYKNESTGQDTSAISIIPQRLLVKKSMAPGEQRILIIGESGIGKTTFINGLDMYQQWPTFESAIKNSRPLISSSFIIHKDSAMSSIKITSKGRAKTNSENTNTIDESSTQHIVTYYVKRIARPDMNYVDTPGINDTRGQSIDNHNIEQLNDYFRTHEEISAICILMKPNVSRITDGMRYCFEQLLKLHQSARHNIFFCFTNAPRGPGDSLVTLERLLAETKGKLQSNCFSFDNSCIRYLNTIRQDPSMRTEDRDKMYSEIWLKNVDMTQRLLQAIRKRGRIQLKHSCNIINVDKQLLLISTELSKYFPSLPKDLEAVKRLVSHCALMKAYLSQNSLFTTTDHLNVAIKNNTAQNPLSQLTNYHDNMYWKWKSEYFKKEESKRSPSNKEGLIRMINNDLRDIEKNFYDFSAKIISLFAEHNLFLEE